MATNATTLNIVWHGSFLFFTDKNDIKVLIPDGVGDHVYYAGPWKVGGLQPLHKRTHYTLDGAKGGGELPIPNIIDFGDVVSDWKKRVYSYWTVPYPVSIHAPTSVNSDATQNFPNHSAEIRIPDELGIAYVFSYEIQDKAFSVVAAPMGEDGNDESPSTAVNGILTPGENLHVFFQEDHRLSPDTGTQNKHASDSFEAVAHLTKAGQRPGTIWEIDYKGEVPLVHPVDLKGVDDVRRIELVGLAVSCLLTPGQVTPGDQAGVVDTGNTPTIMCPPGNGH